MRVTHFLSALLMSPTAHASVADIIQTKFYERIKPCMNSKDAPEVADCMITEAKQCQKKYQSEFKKYLASIAFQDEISHDKGHLIAFAKKAKQGWDMYMQNECLAKSSDYVEHNYSYNLCLIEKYNQRIEYYKTNP